MRADFYRFLSLILAELHQERYHLSGEILGQMEELARQCMVMVIGENETEKEVEVPLCTREGDCREHVEVRNFSQVADYPPLLEEGRLVLVKPWVILKEGGWFEEHRESVLVHEICHLLSIGPYEWKGNHLWHHMGLLYCAFSMDDDGTGLVAEEIWDGCEETSNCYNENEWTNDFVASVLYQAIRPETEYHFEPASRRWMEKKLERMRRNGTTKEEVIRKYFSGEYVKKRMYE